jgi:hypothetical protein
MKPMQVSRIPYGRKTGSVAAAALGQLIGVALGHITRSTAAAVGWVLFAEEAILRTVAPQQAQPA